jgi:hypothetical protein
MRSFALRSGVFGSVLVSAALLAPRLSAQAANESGPRAQPRVIDGKASGLGDAAELAKVVGLYEGGKYAECAEQLRELLRAEGPRPLRDPDVIENARIYQAACLIGSGSPELADAPLAAAIRQNTLMKAPDSVVFPPQVIDRFFRVRETLFKEIRKAEGERVEKAKKQAELQEQKTRIERERVRELERRAQEQVLVIRNRRWVALVPFGVGQFQNGDRALGWTFLASEVLLGAAALTTIGVESRLVLEANRLEARGAKPDPDINTRTANWMTAFKYTSFGFIGVSLAGIVEAELSFVPETREIRKGPLPQSLAPGKNAKSRFAPSASITPNGAWLGVSGQF